MTVAGGGGGGGHVGGGGGAGGLLFNENISLSGQKTIVVGSGGDSVVDRTRGLNGNDTYIDLMYTVAGGGGHKRLILTASDAGGTDYFADNVSMSGDYVIVGAKANDSSKGAAYIFMDRIRVARHGPQHS